MWTEAEVNPCGRVTTGADHQIGDTNEHSVECPGSAPPARVSVGMGRYRLCPLATLDGGAPSVKPAPWVVVALAL